MLQRVREDKKRPESGDSAASSGGEAEHPVDEWVLCSEVTPPHRTCPFRILCIAQRRCRHRPVQYLNNILEQDHRAIKKKTEGGLEIEGKGAPNGPLGWSAGNEIRLTRPARKNKRRDERTLTSRPAIRS